MTAFLNDDLPARVLPEFASTLVDRHDVSKVLDLLTRNLVELLEAAGAEVVMLADLADGPGMEAARQGRVVHVPDIGLTDGTWPRWEREARERNVRAVLCLPLRAREQALGAVVVHSCQPRTWQQVEVTAARALADMAASYVALASEVDEWRRTTEQLREALESRIVIEQAKGVLANDLGCTVDQAFVVLREHARRNNASLRDVAHGVVHLGLRPRNGER